VQCCDPKSAQNEAIYKEAGQQARKRQPVDAAVARERAKLAERGSPYVTMPERESAYADMPEKESTYSKVVERDSAYGRYGGRAADGRRVIGEGRVSWR
jgi:hypothetical protein